jgi:DNA-binding beta-propeller fold protein YncE
MLRSRSTYLTIALLVFCGFTLMSSAAPAQVMIVGNDEKVSFDDAGKVVTGSEGRDTISIVDIGTDPESPKILVNLPLTNSIVGPPVNLAITPDERLAIVANSLNTVPEGTAWKAVPDNKLYVIDLKAKPPKHIATVEVGKQPSGLSISPRGDLALVTNRADNSIGVLAIHQDEVKLIDTIPMGDMVTHVVFTPDGTRALAAKFAAHKVALLKIQGQKVTYDKYDMPVGLWPYNVNVTPNGKLALTADNGNSGRSDGHIDTVSVIDLEANPPRVIDRVVVGDAPEGLAISPTGEIAVAMLLNGNDGPKNAWFYHRNGRVAVLKIDGKKVTKVDEVEVRGLPEGVVFSPDGRHLYVGNFIDSDVSILKVDGAKVTDTGKRLQLPGHPASMRGRVQ